jgi:hypothetical protein
LGKIPFGFDQRRFLRLHVRFRCLDLVAACPEVRGLYLRLQLRHPLAILSLAERAIDFPPRRGAGPQQLLLSRELLFRKACAARACLEVAPRPPQFRLPSSFLVPRDLRVPGRAVARRAARPTHSPTQKEAAGFYLLSPLDMQRPRRRRRAERRYRRIAFDVTCTLSGRE